VCIKPGTVQPDFVAYLTRLLSLTELACRRSFDQDLVELGDRADTGSDAPTACWASPLAVVRTCKAPGGKAMVPRMEAGEMIWDEVKRSISRQESNLDSLRTRALTLLSASGVIAALFSPRTLDRRIDAISMAVLILALGAFAVSVMLAVAVQWSRRYAFAFQMDAWFEGQEHRTDLTADQLSYRLSKHLWQAHKCNKTTIETTTKELIGLCAVLAIEVVGWMISLA